MSVVWIVLVSRSARSAKFSEVFGRLASALPNLQRLTIYRAREFLSQKE
jgi:hypothetical protein